MQTLKNNPKISSLLYLVTSIESLFLLIVGGGILFFPSVIRPLWPWSLAPFNALLLGAIYTSSLVATAIVVYVKRWAPTRLVLPMIFIFTAIILVVCLIYFDRFDFQYWGTWVWFFLYIIIPVNSAYHMWLYRNQKPVDPAPLPAFWRDVILIPSILLGLYGIGLLIAPDSFSSFWPWQIDDFHSRMYSVLYITPAIGALLLFRAAASIELLTIGLTQIVGSSATILGIVIIDNQLEKIEWSAFGTWLWISSFVIILLTGIGLVWQSRARSRSKIPSAT
ncbi:MAG: hypothetical protein MUO67_20240 [Anaerolineales bacterium]|nr:hypothetical protein [Anaerolineales bacterium]